MRAVKLRSRSGQHHESGQGHPAVSGPHLIAVDWGTTAMRCYLVAEDGSILDRAETESGILSVANGDFSAVLRQSIGRLQPAGLTLPVVMSGMIGSRQGWIEAPYVNCPCSLALVAAGLVEVGQVGQHRIYLIPGLMTRSEDGMPDVIRGEETQVFGALASLGIDGGLFVLPGTHSKWINVANNTITGFRTYMTGEIFKALKNHTILGRLNEPGAEPDDSYAAGVSAGATAGAPGDLMHRVFSARTLCLAGDLRPTGVDSYLSGLLIGAELAAGTRENDQPIYILAGSTLSDLYARAAGILAVPATVVEDRAIVQGHIALFDAARV